MSTVARKFGYALDFFGKLASLQGREIGTRVGGFVAGAAAATREIYTPDPALYPGGEPLSLEEECWRA